MASGRGADQTPWSHRLHRRVSLSCGHCSDHGTSCRKQRLRRPDFQLEQFCVCSQGPHVASPVRSASWPGCLRILLRTSQRRPALWLGFLEKEAEAVRVFPPWSVSSARVYKAELSRPKRSVPPGAQQEPRKGSPGAGWSAP